MTDFLIDGFGRRHTYLRLSLTERCNLRCTYCMPAEGVPLKPRSEILTFEEIVRLSKLFVNGGVRKIRLTGGEPLVRKDVEDLADEIGAIPGLKAFAITTNGLLLPRKIDRLRAAGVNQINISLDTLDSDRFATITRRSGLASVLAAIDGALRVGYDPVKVNCVVLRGFNDDELVDFVGLTKDKAIEVRFIEYMPFQGNGWSDATLVRYSEMLALISKSVDLQRLDDGPNDTSKTFCVPGYRGKVGFITSMSENFCAGCNRLRITADGSLKVCLFGRSELSLRDAMRRGASDGELESLIGAAVSRKKAAHAGMYQIALDQNRPMILIGG